MDLESGSADKSWSGLDVEGGGGKGCLLACVIGWMESATDGEREGKRTARGERGRNTMASVLNVIFERQTLRNHEVCESTDSLTHDRIGGKSGLGVLMRRVQVRLPMENVQRGKRTKTGETNVFSTPSLLANYKSDTLPVGKVTVNI